MRRPLAVLAMAIALVGGLTGGLAWLLDTPRVPPGASREERIYRELCAPCHGVDGQGSWRATLFLIRPGNLTGPDVRRDSDQYLFDIIENGGAPIGRPGMPAFGSQLRESDIRALVDYIRRLGAS
jgi:mono/diheme cytochrome c family protein